MQRRKEDVNALDAEILNMLDAYPALSQEAIACMLKEPKFKICKRLRKLHRLRYIQVSTRKNSRYWKRVHKEGNSF